MRGWKRAFWSSSFPSIPDPIQIVSVVLDMRSDGLQLQVRNVVILLVSINVMDVVVRRNRAIMLLPDDSVFIFAPESSSFAVRPDALDVASVGLCEPVIGLVHR